MCDSLCKNIGTSALVAPIAVLFFVIDAMVNVVECAISAMLLGTVYVIIKGINADSLLIAC